MVLLARGKEARYEIHRYNYRSKGAYLIWDAGKLLDPLQKNMVSLSNPFIIIIIIIIIITLHIIIIIIIKNSSHYYYYYYYYY